MKDIWYGDNRDLIKWGVLLTLADQHRIGRILQVAYFRPSIWPTIEIDGVAHPLPAEVVEHFRDFRTIARLPKGPRSLEILPIEVPFVDRDRYLSAVIDAILESPAPSIVFLDPDTGLQPPRPSMEHILESELTAIWDRMRESDVLVFYQHKTNRTGAPWIDPKRAQFERAIGIAPGSARLAGGAAARDAVFFIAPKILP
jgi:hypothetical protein